MSTPERQRKCLLAQQCWRIPLCSLRSVVLQSIELSLSSYCTRCQWSEVNAPHRIYISKVALHLYFLKHLGPSDGRSGAGLNDLLNFYCTVIRPVLEYVWRIYMDWRRRTWRTTVWQSLPLLASDCETRAVRRHRDTNNNNPICKAPECQKTSVALADRNSRAN